MPRLSIRNWIAVILVLSSLFMLYPGLTQPMLNLTISAKVPLLGTMEFYNKTQSIASSISALFNSGNIVVAALILLFSVIVPVVKAVLLMTALLAPLTMRMRLRLYAVVSVIGKWSMADVFAVGVFLAYLAGNANSSAEAVLFNGFYYFVTYCVLSVLGAQIMKMENN